MLGLAEALSAADRGAICDLTAESYVGARDLFEIGSSEMAAMMDAMRSAPGVIGARQAGAGFGGCMVALVDAPQVEGFARHVEKTYARATGIEPKVYPTDAAAGAGPLPTGSANRASWGGADLQARELGRPTQPRCSVATENTVSRCVVQDRPDYANVDPAQ